MIWAAGTNEGLEMVEATIVVKKKPWKTKIARNNVLFTELQTILSSTDRKTCETVVFNIFRLNIFKLLATLFPLKSSGTIEWAHSENFLNHQLKFVFSTRICFLKLTNCLWRYKTAALRTSAQILHEFEDDQYDVGLQSVLIKLY